MFKEFDLTTGKLIKEMHIHTLLKNSEFFNMTLMGMENHVMYSTSFKFSGNVVALSGKIITIFIDVSKFEIIKIIANTQVPPPGYLDPGISAAVSPKVQYYWVPGHKYATGIANNGSHNGSNIISNTNPVLVVKF